jgi:hypothetical protein
MSDPSVALDFDQALDIHTHLAAQVTLNHVFFVYRLSDAVHLFFGEVIHPSVRVHVGLRQDVLGAGRPDAIYVCKGNFYPLITGYVYTGNSCHSFPPLALSLLMLRVATNDHHYACAFDDPALRATRLH